MSIIDSLVIQKHGIMHMYVLSRICALRSNVSSWVRSVKYGHWNTVNGKSTSSNECAKKIEMKSCAAPMSHWLDLNV